VSGDFITDGAEVWAQDIEDTEELYAELSGVPGVTVEAAAEAVQPGDEGAALDVLMVTLSSGAVTAFLQIIKVLAESKGPKFELTIRRGRDRLKITADNLDEVEPVIRRLFGRQ